jgi:hypothetical protein
MFMENLPMLREHPGAALDVVAPYLNVRLKYFGWFPKNSDLVGM